MLEGVHFSTSHWLIKIKQRSSNDSDAHDWADCKIRKKGKIIWIELPTCKIDRLIFIFYREPQFEALSTVSVVISLIYNQQLAASHPINSSRVVKIIQRNNAADNHWIAYFNLCFIGYWQVTLHENSQNVLNSCAATCFILSSTTGLSTDSFQFSERLQGDFYRKWQEAWGHRYRGHEILQIYVQLKEPLIAS